MQHKCNINALLQPSADANHGEQSMAPRVMQTSGLQVGDQDVKSGSAWEEKGLLSDEDMSDSWAANKWKIHTHTWAAWSTAGKHFLLALGPQLCPPGFPGTG